MVDEAAQKARRERMLAAARNDTAIWVSLFLFALFSLVAFIPAGVIHIIRVIVAGATPEAIKEISFLSSWLFVEFVIVAGLVLVALADRETAIERATAEANNFDMAERQAEAAAMAARRRVLAEAEQARRDEAERRKQYAQWEREQAAREAERARAERLRELEGQVLIGWTEFQLRSSFGDSGNQAQMLRNYSAGLLSRLPAADLALLRSSQNPTVRGIVGGSAALG